MRFGNCVSVDQAKVFHDAGYDFAELPIVSTLQPEVTESIIMPSIKGAISASGIAPEVWYLFLPGDMRIIGESVDNDRLAAYLDSACARIAQVGGKVILFGSAGFVKSRRVSRETAGHQLTEMLLQSAQAAEANGLTIALLPMCSRVCNHINTVTEAVAAVRRANHPALGVAVDLFHMTEDGQALEEIREAGSLLAHVHVSGEGRRAPIAADTPRLTEMFRVLKDINYTGRVAIEAVWDNVQAQAAEALDTMRRAWDMA